jgi:hypothetical protein
MNKFKIATAQAFTGLMLVALVATPFTNVFASTAGSTNSCGSFTRSLTIGSTGADVVSLQNFLEAKGFLTIPQGVSRGYFGGLTQSALARYQASVGIAPAAGYFGPITRADVSTKCGNTTPTNPNPKPGTDLNGDEASLESFDFSSGDDSDVEEGQSGDVAEIEFDVEDGDVMLNRVDLKFENASSTDTDLWDVLETVELVIDGDVVGEADLSDEDEYLDEDDGTVRISGINTKIKEGDSAKMIVRVTAQKNVDSDDQDTFTVNVVDDGIRATDAKGIQQYIGSDSETVDFDVQEAGADEELNVSSSSNDPDATTLKVENDKKSDLYEIFVFDLKGEDNDIELDTVQVLIETSATTSNMISDLVLEIDGEEFDDWEYVSGGNGTSSRVVEFNIDGDYTLEADDEVEVVLKAEFKAANDSNYSSGATISAEIQNGGVEGEGAEDVTSDGVASGETHTLATEGVVINESGFSDEGSAANNDNGTSRDFTFTFEVTAFEEDFYVATDSVNVFVEGAGSASTTYTVDSTGDEDTNGVFTIEEGETETFTVVVTVSNVSTSGQYRVGLDSVEYTTNPDGVSNLETKDLVNSDFRTAYRTINN